MPIDPKTGKEVERLYPNANSDTGNTGNTTPTTPQAPTLPPATGAFGSGGPVFGGDVQFTNTQSFSPTTAPYGMDMSMPGYQQQMWDRNQQLWLQSPTMDWVNSLLPQFQDPWAGEQANTQLLSSMSGPGAGQQFWNGVKGNFNTMTPAEQSMQRGYTGKNNALSAFGQTQARLPNSFQPQFDAYYDRMKDKVMSDVNTQSAARGVYGGSPALNNSIGAGLDVEAQRAKAATDFMFQDSQNQMNWLNSLSQQGRTADLTGLDIFGANEKAARFGLDRTKTYGDLAFQADESELARDRERAKLAFGLDEQRGARLGSAVNAGLGVSNAELSRLNSAMSAAGQADDERSGRIDSIYNKVAGMSDDVQDFFMDNYNALISGDMNMSSESMQTAIAQMADQRGWTQQQRAQFSQDIADLIGGLTGAEANQVSKG